MVVVSSNFSAPVDGILLEAPSTKLLINNQEIGTATLYVTESNVVWGGGVRAAGGPSPTISLLYPTISLHAIQRDPSPALYMILNYELSLPELTTQSSSGGGDAEDDDDDDAFDADDPPITELRFVPANEGDLQAMYAAMNQGQALHPDPADEVDEDPYMDGEEFDDGEDEFEDAEETNPTAEAAARLRQLRLQATNGAQQFEDAEDVEIAGNGDDIAEE